MDVCIIGASGHYGYVLDGIRGEKDVRITGVAPGSYGEDMRSLYSRVSALGHTPEMCDDYRQMLDRLKPDIAVINSYFGDHARIVLEVLKRGIHVFVEKPVATTFEDLGLVRDAYKKSGVYLAGMFGIRYSAHFLTAWEAVRNGAIGKIRLMNAQKSYKLGTRADFFKHRSSYGGTIPWVGSHAIDWLYWFSGERFKTVYASHSALYNRGHGELEVSALCHFAFTNEVYGSVNIDYLRPQSAPTHGDDRIRIAGTSGVIEVRDNKVYLINEEGPGVQQLPLLQEQQIFADFLRQVRGEGKCMVSGEDSLYVTEACLRARLSADEKRVVEF